MLVLLCFLFNFKQYFSYIMEVRFIGGRKIGKPHRPTANLLQSLSYNVVSSTLYLEVDTGKSMPLTPTKKYPYLVRLEVWSDC